MNAIIVTTFYCICATRNVCLYSLDKDRQKDIQRIVMVYVPRMPSRLNTRLELKKYTLFYI